MYLIKWPVRQKCTEALTSAGTVKCVAWVMLVKEKKKVNVQFCLIERLLSSSRLFMLLFPPALLTLIHQVSSSSLFWTQRCVQPSKQLPLIQSINYQYRPYHIPPCQHSHTSPFSPQSLLICPNFYVCMYSGKKTSFWTPTFLLNPN